MAAKRPHRSGPDLAVFLRGYILVPVIVACLAVFYLDAIPRHWLVDFTAYNGKYQTFNSIARILEGQVPGRDFQPYLGIGTTYAALLGTIVGGGDFLGSIIGVAFMHSVFFAAYAAVILLVLGCGRRMMVYLAIGFLLCATVFYAQRLHVALSSVDQPAFTLWMVALRPVNSDYGLRMAAPFIMSFLAWFIFARTKDVSARRRLWARTSTILLASGFLPFWSNDAGFAAALMAGILIYAVFSAEKSRPVPAWLAASLFYAALIPVAAVVGYVITLGGLSQWLDYNIFGVAAQQYWFFAFEDSGSVWEKIATMPPSVMILMALGLTIVLLHRRSPQRWLLIYLLSSTFAASAIPYFTFSPKVRYFTAFAVAVIGVVFAEMALRLMRRYPILLPRIIAAVVLGLLTLRGAQVVDAKYQTLFATEPSTGRIAVPELGGTLSNQFASAVTWARRLRDDLHDVPPQSRMISNYPSMIDHIVGARNTAGADYIIHVIGKEHQDRYLDQWRTTAPRYATTMRDDYARPSWWSMRHDWWFYDYLIDHYDAMAVTHYNIIWKVRPEKRSREPYRDCTVVEDDRGWLIRVSAGAALSPSFESILGTLIEIRLEQKPPPGNILGRRPLLFTQEIQSKRYEAGRNDRDIKISLDPGRRILTFPAEYDPATPLTIAVLASSKGPKAAITSCAWRPVAAISDLGQFANVSLAGPTGNRPGWDRGIATSATYQQYRAGLLLDETASDLTRDLFTDGLVFLANGESRRIKTISGRIIWLDGPPLDPDAVGYPHPIRFFLR